MIRAGLQRFLMGVLQPCKLLSTCASVASRAPVTGLIDLLKDYANTIARSSTRSAQFDFRSSRAPHVQHQRLTIGTGDVITTPSLSMLAAIIKTTFHDDVFREDSTTKVSRLEARKSHTRFEM
jgi:hypothetical protein